MQQTLEQQEKSLRSFMKNRWLFTCIWLVNIAIQISRVFDKRSQWPFILRLSLPPGVVIWTSVWENIFVIALLFLGLILWWVRFHNYKRELLLAGQMALQKAAKPPEGVWPPPPVS